MQLLFRSRINQRLQLQSRWRHGINFRYGYSRGGGAEPIADYSQSRGSGTERP